MFPFVQSVWDNLRCFRTHPKEKLWELRECHGETIGNFGGGAHQWELGEHIDNLGKHVGAHCEQRKQILFAPQPKI